MVFEDWTYDYEYDYDVNFYSYSKISLDGVLVWSNQQEFGVDASYSQYRVPRIKVSPDETFCAVWARIWETEDYVDTLETI